MDLTFTQKLGRAMYAGGGGDLDDFNKYDELKRNAEDWRTNAQAQITMRLAASRGIDPTNKTQEQLFSEISQADKQLVTIDPTTGEQLNSFSAPYNTTFRKGVMSPEQIKQRAIAEGEGKAIETDIANTSKLGTAVKRLAIINKQFAEALPSGDRTPLEQRIYGGTEALKAKYGFSDNKKLLAIQKNLRPIAINMVRAFGEVGNLSETEQQGAIDTVDQAGLTDQERIESTRQFIEYALAGARPESLELIKKRKDIRGVLDAFGVDLGDFTGEKDDWNKTSNGLKYKVIK